MIYKGMVCQWCGATFTAQKSSTRYCSKRCANLANKQKIREMTQGIVESQNMEKLRLINKEREVMSPKALAEYLGICKSTAYNYLNRRLFPVLQSPGKTFIRKKDIDSIFDSAAPYQKRAVRNVVPTKESPAVPALKESHDERYTTAKEVAERYKMSFAGADRILKESGITLIRHKNKHYYYLSEVEAVFRKRELESHHEITEWYTCAEIQEKFNLKPASVYDIVSSYKIPTKKLHNVTHYSKIHFDMARGIKPAGSELWYTVQEAMEKYGQTRDQVYGILRYNHIQRVQIGRHVKFRRDDYDQNVKFYINATDK